MICLCEKSRPGQMRSAPSLLGDGSGLAGGARTCNMHAAHPLVQRYGTGHIQHTGTMVEAGAEYIVPR